MLNFEFLKNVKLLFYTKWWCLCMPSRKIIATNDHSLLNICYIYYVCQCISYIVCHLLQKFYELWLKTLYIKRKKERKIAKFFDKFSLSTHIILTKLNANITNNVLTNIKLTDQSAIFIVQSSNNNENLFHYSI